MHTPNTTPSPDAPRNTTPSAPHTSAPNTTPSPDAPRNTTPSAPHTTDQHTHTQQTPHTTGQHTHAQQTPHTPSPDAPRNTTPSAPHTSAPHTRAPHTTGQHTHAQQTPHTHTPTPHPPALAIFDLDKTIINTSASLAYGRPLAERGLLTTTEVLRMIAIRSSYMFTTHTDADLDATKETLTAMLKGREVEPLREVAREALTEVITPYIYAEARELLQWHRDQGHTIAIVTASPDVVVEPIAQELQADILIASTLETKDGKFTGNVTRYNKGATKVHHIEDIAQAGGYDLGASYAYSDSGTDIPMLELVGYPTAVNPDRHLRKEATKRGWPITNFERPEPLFQSSTAVIAGAGATLALLGALATGVVYWLSSRDGTDGNTDQLSA